MLCVHHATEYVGHIPPLILRKKNSQRREFVHFDEKKG
jgi:hypothetical protein